MPAIIAYPTRSIQFPQNNYLPQSVSTLDQPAEGNFTIPVGITWLTDVGAGNSFGFDGDGSGLTRQKFSQIATLYVDNSFCSAPVVIVFPDTQFAVEAPAFTAGYYPVVTAQRRFVAFCPNAQSGDKTLMQVLNYHVEPDANSTFEQALFASTTGTNFGGGVSTVYATLVATGLSGILRAAKISVANANAGAAAGTGSIGLLDQSHTIVYAFANIGTIANQNVPFEQVIDLNDVAIKFTNGLAIQINNINPPFTSGVVTGSVYYIASN